MAVSPRCARAVAGALCAWVRKDGEGAFGMAAESGADGRGPGGGRRGRAARAVIVDPGRCTAPGPLVLELRCPAGEMVYDRIGPALGRIAAHRPTARTHHWELRPAGPGRAVLTLHGPDPEGFPVGLLADLLTAGGPDEAGPPAPDSASDPGDVPAPGRTRGSEGEAGADPGAGAEEEHGAVGSGGAGSAVVGASDERARGPGVCRAGAHDGAAEAVRRVGVSPLQRELLVGEAAAPGGGRHVEQSLWAWHGPLDTERFRRAWQSVVDRERVLRAAFENAAGPAPALLLHERVTAEVRCLAHGAADWAQLVQRDRRRGMDVRRPGPLRITLLGGVRRSPDTDGPLPHRFVLTYHHALLDEWSVRLLLREFCRAYLAGGRLPGGERRPDVADHVRWLEGRDPGPAREFWSSVAPPAGAGPVPVALPAGAEEPARGTRPGRARARLTPDETTRLATWAADWGATESSALQTAWALLLHRDSGAEGPRPVRFDVAVSGRGVPLDGVERMAGALRNPLPVWIEVDPGGTVPALLRALRDRVLDMGGYEWVSAGQVAEWTGRTGTAAGPVSLGETTRGPAPDEEPGSLLVFKSRLRPGPLDGLAEHGIRIEELGTLDAPSGHALTLVAHHDDTGGLVLAATHELPRPGEARGLLREGVHLLRELPRAADGSTTIRRVLELVGTAAPDGGAPRRPHVATLRTATRPGAGAVCLVPAHGVPRARYEQVARRWTGPEALVLLDPVPGTVPERRTALRSLAAHGACPVLGGWSGAGSTAHELARLLAAAGSRAPLLVLVDGSAPADALARLLATAAAERAG